MLCFKVKCQRRKQHKHVVLVDTVVVVSQNKKQQKKQRTITHTHKVTTGTQVTYTHAQFVFWLRKLFHGHMYIQACVCMCVHTYTHMSPRFSISYQNCQCVYFSYLLKSLIRRLRAGVDMFYNVTTTCVKCKLERLSNAIFYKQKQ